MKLRRLEGWNERRRQLATLYSQELQGIAGLRLPHEAPGCRAVYHQYTVRSERRDALRLHLEARGIASVIHYPHPLHLQPAYAHLGLKPGSLPVAEKAAEEVLCLPIYPELSDDDARRVAKEVKDFFST